MLQRIIDFSVKNPFWIAFFTLGMALVGLVQLRQLPIDAVPDITNNQVQVIAVAPSLGAVDVERLITQPVENSCRNIPDLVEMRSFSRMGLSVITLVFEEHVDVYWARQQVSERLLEAGEQIPPVLSNPYLAPVTTGLGEIYQYVLRAAPGYENRYSLTDLRTLQDWLVRRQLLGVPGVADVSSFGGQVKQYEISVHPGRLQAHGVSLTQLVQAVEANNQNAGGAYIHRDATQLSIRSEGMIRSPSELESILVRTSSKGLPILLKDVADVKVGHAVRYGTLTYQGDGEVTGGVVMMLKGANSGKVIEAVKARIGEIRDNLPQGVILEPFLDRTKMVNAAIHTVSVNLAEGALIVVLILVFFLGNLRAGLLVASVIPLSMLFAVSCMNLFGVSGNLMSLGALDFGLIVDGAVIVVEAVMHRLQLSRNTADTLDARSPLAKAKLLDEVRFSAGKMMGAASFGQLIILMVYLPILTLRGIEGKMFVPMAQTVLFALLGAYLLSLTYIPMMSGLVLRWNAREWSLGQRWMEGVGRLQQKMLGIFLDQPLPWLAGILALGLLSGWAFGRLGGEFIPDLPEGDFAVETKLLPGANLQTTTEAVLKASALLQKEYPEIIKIVGKVGSGEIPTDPMPLEAADLMIILKDKSEWTSAGTWDELAQRMSATLEEIPGVAFGFQYPVAMRFNELMTGAKQDVVLKIYGENLDTLSRIGSQLGHLVGKVAGVRDLWVESVEGLPQLIVRYKRPALARYGLTVQDLNQQVQTAYAGMPAGILFEDEKRFDLVVRMPEELRLQPDAVGDLPVLCSDGQSIPLREVADILVETGVHQIQRDFARRRLMVAFNVGERDVQSLVQEVQSKIKQGLALPAGYFLHYGGSFEHLEHARQRLALAVPLALGLILILLTVAMGSLRMALLVFVTVPLSAIGGILWLWMRDIPFSISAGVGFIVLFGVSVLNGIVLIKEFLSLEASNQGGLKNLVLQGTLNRLRPVLMTASVASLGFLPMALSQGAGAEVQRPLATVVIGGLLLATLLTLFVLPFLYMKFRPSSPEANESGGTGPHTSPPGDHFPVNGTTAPPFPAAVVWSLLILWALCMPKTLEAQDQQHIDLREALQRATQRWPLLKADSLNLQAKQLQSRAHPMLEPSVWGTEWGQINSVLRDQAVLWSQSMRWPSYYGRQQQVSKVREEGARLQLVQTKSQMELRLRDIFQHYLCQNARYSLLKHNDSILEVTVKILEFRESKGLVSTSDLQQIVLIRGESAVQLTGLLHELQSTLQEVQWMTGLPRIPFSSDSNLLWTEGLADTLTIRESPGLSLLRNNWQEAEATYRVGQAQRWPGLNLGLRNMTIQGMGPDGVVYPPSRRFNTLQIGLMLPMLPKNWKLEAQALKSEAAAKSLSLAHGQAQTDLWRSQNQAEIRSLYAQWEQYRTRLIPVADRLQKQADAQLAGGELDLIQWTHTLQRLLQTREQFILLTEQLNRALLRLHFPQFQP